MPGSNSSSNNNSNSDSDNNSNSTSTYHSTYPPTHPPNQASKPDNKASAPSAEPKLHAPIRRTFDAPAQRTTMPAKILRALRQLLIVVGAMLLGYAIFNQAMGQWIVIAVGLAAVVLRLSSRYIFGAAFFFLILVVVSSIMNNKYLADNFAVYTYLLLAIGTLGAMIELRGSDRFRYRKQRNYR
jgi:hypothetical protein